MERSQSRSRLRWPLRRIFWPPSLVLRQLGSVLYFQHLIRWRHFPAWLFKHSLKSLPVAAGSIGMGCIGFPAHPVWEVTGACNLRCIHCHAASGKPAPDELTTDEGKRLIDALARVDEFRMLVYSGGEPLVRPDLFELLEHSKQAGFINVIATNGTLIDDEVAQRLREAGVAGAAVSLDSSLAAVHNRIRANPTAFERALAGMEAIKRAGILLQVNTTAMEYNFAQLTELIDLADSYDSGIMLMYQLVPVGRGTHIARAALDLQANETLLTYLAEKQPQIATIVEPVAGPQYWPYLLERQGMTSKLALRLAEQVFHGCAAGRGFVYIKANGEVWPCPFVELSAGTVRQQPFDEIWRTGEIFVNLRHREETLKGKCGDCRYRTLCGGCRGRALAYHGDYLQEDPSCFIGERRAAP